MLWFVFGIVAAWLLVAVVEYVVSLHVASWHVPVPVYTRSRAGGLVVTRRHR